MKKILIIAVLMITAYGWMTNSLPFLSGNTESQEDQEALSKPKEKSAKEVLTPDQFGQQGTFDIDDAPSAPSEADIVPQQLLEMEAEAKAGNALYNAAMDDVALPPIYPSRPDYKPSSHQLPPTEPELEVVPEDLRALESQPRPEPLNTNMDVPMVGSPEAAEVDVEQDALQIEESRHGH
jgi:hypothetical protein